MASTYRYRALKSSWGVAVDITAEVGSDVTGAEPVAENLFLRVEVSLGLTSPEHACLMQGLRLVAGKIHAHTSSDTPTVIRVLALEYNLCDYQPEGLTCALAGWAAQECGFSVPIIQVTFDSQANRYLFNFSANTQGEAA